MAKWIISKRKFDNILDQVLYNRGLTGSEKQSKEDFLNPNFSKLHDPYLMKNLNQAALRIEKAQKEGEIVGVFADYDADGIPGAALLYRALTKIGIKTFVYIPNREGGYGLSVEGIEYLRNKKCSLIITVDLGIRNFSEALYCKKVGIDLIVTDHHAPDKVIPRANLVINPKIASDKYPFCDLAGGGVAYKLICGLSKIFPNDLDESFLKWNLDLVAISTISDVVSLLGENRILARYGLHVLKKTKNIGLQELYKIAKIDPENIGAYHVGFQIAPRINAPGRMDHATKSFELLVTEDRKEARSLALWLEEKNNDRQVAMQETEAEAFSKIEKNNLTFNSIIVVWGDWMKGVIGPVASRLVEKFSRPVIMFAQEEESYCGSARSIGDVNILELVDKSKSYMEKFGGHKGACGLTVSKVKFEGFLSSIIENANKTIKKEQLQKKINIDAESEISDLTIDLWENLKKLEPYGMGNPKPVFKVTNLEVIGKKYVGAEEKHLAIQFKKDQDAIKAIFFGGALVGVKIELHNMYDVVFSLDLDTWQGKRELKMNVIDMKVTNETK